MPCIDFRIQKPPFTMSISVLISIGNRPCSLERTFDIRSPISPPWPGQIGLGVSYQDDTGSRPVGVKNSFLLSKDL